MDFGTLGTSLRKFVRPILRLLGPLSSFPWSICSLRDPQEVIGGCFPHWNRLWNSSYIFKKIWYIHKKIWYIQSQGYQYPYFSSHSLFVPLGTPREVIGSCFPPRNKLWLGTSFRKFSTFRNDNFAGKSGHLPHLTPIGTGMRLYYLGIEWIWGVYKNPNRVQGEDRFCNYPPRPIYELLIYPYNITKYPKSPPYI